MLLSPDDHIARAEALLEMGTIQPPAPVPTAQELLDGTTPPRRITRPTIDSGMIAAAAAHSALASAMIASDAVKIATAQHSPQWVQSDPAAVGAHQCPTCGSYDREVRHPLTESETAVVPCFDGWHDVPEPVLV